MRRSFLALVGVLAAAPFSQGCSACSFPFSVDSGGTVVIPLGVVGDCTGADNGTVPDDGQPDADGNLTTFTHQNDGTTCTMDAAWAGHLVDMKKARADAEKSIKDQGLDPSTVAVTVTGFAPSVKTVTLRDDGSTQQPSIDLGADALKTYAGAINIAGATNVITANFDSATDTNPLAPRTSTNVPQAVLDAANAAYQANSNLDATGTGNVTVDMTALTPLQTPVKPALVVDFKLTIEGTASASLGQ